MYLELLGLVRTDRHLDADALRNWGRFRNSLTIQIEMMQAGKLRTFDVPCFQKDTTAASLFIAEQCLAEIERMLWTEGQGGGGLAAA